MRKPITSQILDRKQRQGEPRFGAELVSQVDNIGNVWRSDHETATFLENYIPICLVTIIEVFVREAVRELVDHGQPYFGRAEKLTKSAKIDFAFAEHMDRRILSVGDFVSHAISTNSIEGIIASLDALTHDFSQELKTSHPRWTEEQGEWPLKPIISDYDTTIAGVARLFEVRHVLTHELPRDTFFDKSEIDTFLVSTRKFIEACDWLVVNRLHGSVPLTQTQMNIEAGTELENLLAKLDETDGRVQKLNGIDHAHIENANAAWNEFAEKTANLVASNVEGGSMYPMVWASAKAKMVEDRIDQLEHMVENWMS